MYFDKRGLLGKQSDLPGPQQEIRNALTKAKQDPIYRLDLASVETSLLVLYLFVPDEEYESPKRQYTRL